VRFARSSGILLHPTSLPGRFGVGDLGAGAYAFVDWLAEAGQKIWQTLPLGPTGYGDSPYQLFSAFAGNPLLIDLEPLVARGWIDAADLASAPPFPAGEVDYGGALAFKPPLLARAAARFRAHASAAGRDAFEDFRARHAAWLDDFAAFMALKNAHSGAVWTRWSKAAVASREEIEAHEFAQWIFFEQWEALRRHAHERGVRILGDLPIYVAHDSADVWAHPELFLLDERGEPRCVAGVPPDYFCATGQLWGNPIYDWEKVAERSYGWWIDRFRATLDLIDMMRLDHFRGFEAYWRVPAGEATAMNGEWVKGPGAPLFHAVEAVLGPLPIVAENLGVITPEVEALREGLGYPGMSILQFAFGKDPQGPSFRPHNYPRERVVYTGTHDNDTTAGWWASTGEGDSTRTPEDVRKERAFATGYLGLDGEPIHWKLIRTALASVADVALFPLQDVLGLGSEARMNLPGRPAGNWRWRVRPGALTPALARRLRELSVFYDR
jgi:4-alpha-glucanotransferase